MAILHEPGEPWKIARGFSVREEAQDRESPPVTEEEMQIREGWRRYFHSIAIGPRRNPRLQAGHMPKKYWEYLPEMDENEAFMRGSGAVSGLDSSGGGLLLQGLGDAR